MSNKLKAHEIRQRIANKHGITVEQLKEIENAPYSFAKEVIDSLPFDEMTEEEVDMIKKNFNFKYIGKLYTTPKKITRLNKENKNGGD